MVKKLSLPKLYQIFKKRGLTLFSPLDIQKYFKHSNSNTVSQFLSRQTHKGYLIKLKNGLYQFPEEHVLEEVIANKLYPPSYVSLEYAMMIYHIIPETVYAITSVSARSSREFIVNHISYLYRTIKKQAFTGYSKKRQGNFEYIIATPEKALVDWLYFVDIGRKSIQDRIDVTSLSLDKLISYAQLFDRDSLIKLVQKTYDLSRRNKYHLH